MDRSRFLAALIGPTLAIVALSLLVNREVTAQLAGAVAASPVFVLLAGVATLPIGLAIVLSHNVWKGWPAVITVFGWLAVVGGAARILLPQQIAAIAPNILAQGALMIGAMALLLILGLFLSWKAFRP